jgi:hypothetical protein
MTCRIKGTDMQHVMAGKGRREEVILYAQAALPSTAWRCRGCLSLAVKGSLTPAAPLLSFLRPCTVDQRKDQGQERPQCRGSKARQDKAAAVVCREGAARQEASSGSLGGLRIHRTARRWK